MRGAPRGGSSYRAWSLAERVRLTGLVDGKSVRSLTLRNGDDHVAALVSLVDIPVRFDDVVKGKGAVDHGPDITIRGQLSLRT